MFAPAAKLDDTMLRVLLFQLRDEADFDFLGVLVLFVFIRRTKTDVLTNNLSVLSCARYRSLLANFRQELPLTWGELIDADASGFLPRFLGVGELVVVDKENFWFGRRKGTVHGFDASGQNVLLSYDHLADDRHAEDKRGPPSLPVAELVEYNAAARTAALQDWKVPDSLRHLPHLVALVTRLQFSLFNNARLRATPVAFIVEVQFLLTEYLQMRRESHMWYKIMRTPSASDLVVDFYSYVLSHRIRLLLIFHLFVVAGSSAVSKPFDKHSACHSSITSDA